jgi:hypothetical protein
MFNHIFYAGSFVKGRANPYPRQTLLELLTQHTDLSPIQAEAAAVFIRDCLRLNPFDRLTVDLLDEYRWLEAAFMGCKD